VKTSEPVESTELIPFNRPFVTGNEAALVAMAIANRRFSGDGPFTAEASELLRDITGAQRVFLTTSCTHALELAALLLDVGPGDEVIMP
jgi:dTDP-4-amino-4,6-dideoxygalactose transaminase